MLNKLLNVFTKEYREETEYREFAKENVNKFKLGDSKEKNMGLLKALNERPKVVINGEKYVPEDLYREYLTERLEEEKLDCDNQDEKDGIDFAIKCIWNS